MKVLTILIREDQPKEHVMNLNLKQFKTSIRMPDNAM